MISKVFNKTNLHGAYKARIPQDKTPQYQGNSDTVDIGEKSTKNVTYSRPEIKGIDYEAFKQRNEEWVETIRSFVDRILKDQAYLFEQAPENIPVQPVVDDEARKKEEQKQIDSLNKVDNSTNPLEKTAEKIVDFAKTSTGGDREKARHVKEVIFKAMDDVKRSFGPKNKKVIEETKVFIDKNLN